MQPLTPGRLQHDFVLYPRPPALARPCVKKAPLLCLRLLRDLGLRDLEAAASVPDPGCGRRDGALPFAFALCQIGAEAAAKAELARLRPSYRPAFMRPGLLTWKCEPALALDDQADELATAVFFRAFGASLGRASSASEVAERVQSLMASGLALPSGLGFARLCPAGGVMMTILRAMARPTQIRASPRSQPRLSRHRRPHVCVPARRSSRASFCWMSCYRLRRCTPMSLPASRSATSPGCWGCIATARRSPHPGGRLPLRLPPEAPSRAWLKLEEGLAFSGLGLRPGQVAVEIGAAPGGASWALRSAG